MLAKLARELPTGDFIYEPKWDGFRCLAFVRDGEVDLRSRHGRPFSRYFPEIVQALARMPVASLVLDGELVVVRDGRFDFDALMNRLHPAASRVQLLSSISPARFIAFDVLEREGEPLLDVPFAERRRILTDVLAAVDPPLELTPSTTDVRVAEDWLDRYQGGGVDGVVAKQRDLPYVPGARRMIKVKHELTADCVVGGMRPASDGRPVVASLLLGLWNADDAATLEHVGVVSAFPMHQRRALYEELRPLVVPLCGHPWEHGFLTGGGALGRLRGSAGRWTPDMSHDWLPLRPERVVEVLYTQADGLRFRHPARFRRWRPDREARSCTTDQLVPRTTSVADLLDT